MTHRISMLTVTLLGAFTLACSLGEKLNTVGVGSSEGDSGGTGVDDTPEVQRDCPAFFDYATPDSVRTLGFTPEYTTDYGVSGSWTSRVVEWDDRGAEVWITVRTDYDLVYDQNIEDYRATVESVYVCDGEGAWIISYDMDTSYVAQGTPVDYTTNALYDGGWLVMPWDLEAVGSWTASATLISDDSFGNHTEQTYTSSFEVVGAASLTVPAGTFETVELRVTSGDASSAQFRDEDAGTVAGDTYELQSWSDG